jgi:hypothetical protein
MGRLLPRTVALFAALLAAGAAAGPARADQVFIFSNNISGGNNPGTFYTVDVFGPTDSLAGPNGYGQYTNNTPIGAHQALFVVKNAAGAGNPSNSDISGVYFQDGTLLGQAAIYDGPGVGFQQAGSPQNLPGGNSITPAFQTTQNFYETATSPVAQNGVGNGEYLALLYNLQNNYTAADTITALINGLNNPSGSWNNDGSDKAGGALGLRMGIHVQNALSNGTSQSFIIGSPGGGGGTLTPLPPSALLAGLGALGLLGGRFARRKTSA